MHDIDRTLTEFEPEIDALESDQFEFTEELGAYRDGALESPFDEVEEMALAAELLTISSEAELDQFLGKLLKGAWKGIKKVGSVVGKVARPLGGILKGIAKKALPFVGGALGSLIPIPGVGTAVGSALGGALSKALETELEGLSPEDREFEMARRFVRLAGTAAKQVTQAQPNGNPQAAAQAAVLAAARQQMAGMSGAAGGAMATGGAGGAMAAGTPRSGRWIRRGRKIVLLGV